MKILSVQGSLTLVPGVYPLTSTYLPLESKGLTTYPGLPGTALAVGNSACTEEARDDADDFGFSCRASVRLALETFDRGRLLSGADRGRCCVTATSAAGIGWLTPVSVVSIVTASDPSPRFRKA